MQMIFMLHWANEVRTTMTFCALKDVCVSEISDLLQPTEQEMDI